jgi:hypothetical protein
MSYRLHASPLLTVCAAISLASFAASCGDDSAAPTSSSSSTGAGGSGGSGGSGSTGGECELVGMTFDVGDLAGHADPFGAKDAGQARAGRVDDVGGVAQPAHGRQPIQNGDYVLANDKIAVWIEAPGISDGYSRYGGEVIAVDQIGEDGRPMGLSKFLETVMGVSLYVPDTSSVSVLNDGSDGSAAVVRVTGPLRGLAFLEETFGGIFPDTYKDLEVAQDFVLEPGAESVLVRLHITNSTKFDFDTGIDTATHDAFLGFFQYSQNQLVTAEYGFADPAAENTDFLGFDSGGYGFAYLAAGAEPVGFSGVSQSGFQLGFAPAYKLPACTTTTVDHLRLVGGGPDYDGLREAIRRVQGAEPWRAISGVVEDDEGEPVAGAWVHLLGSDGGYVSRTKSNADGEYTVHAPDDDVTLVAQLRGYPNAEAEVSASDDEATLSFGPTGIIHVVATQEGEGRRLPVRVQVIPSAALPPTPAAFGVLDEVDGRLWQEFAVTGEATLHVPPGEHRVIVSRGYEWELLDSTVDVAAGETVEVVAELAHSVDTRGVMCADYHIHSFLSNDSNDPIDFKVKAAIADGLDIPVSSEHEWSIDFQPVIEDLGLEEWAFGVPSEELTTFKWGHFGVLPVLPQPGAHQNGALDWVGKEPPEVFDLVHQMPGNPILIVNHPSGSTGFSSYFTAAGLDETGTSDDALWDDNFDAIEVFNSEDLEAARDGVVKDWFALLNRAARGEGKKFVAVGSSDSHHVRTSPIGYPRTCLQLGTDDPQDISQDDVRDVTGAGRSVISGGLFMTIEGPGGAQPGDSVPPADEATFTITVEAPSWITADSIEVIVNGETITIDDLLPVGEGPSNRYQNEITVPLPEGNSWVVFHAKSEQDLAPLHPGKRAFAASNPIWFQP